MAGICCSGAVKIDRDRLQLGDRQHARHIVGVHDVAGVHQAEAGAAGQRRLDGGVGQLHLGAVDGRLVGLDLGRKTCDSSRALVQQLLGGVALLGQRSRTLEVLPGVGEAGLVLRQLGHRLAERGLERGRVDLHQQIALLHHLAFLEADLLDLPVDPRAHRHRVGRLYGAEPGENDRERLRLHGRDVNRGSLLSCSCLRRRAAGSEVLPAPVRRGDARERRQRPAPPSQPTLGPLRVWPLQRVRLHRDVSFHPALQHRFRQTLPY